MQTLPATYPRLTNETNTWDTILDAINEARDSIYIGAFLWRDDALWNQIAEAVLRAAERGVRIEIDKDSWWVYHEWAEWNHQSLFHTERNMKAYAYLILQRPKLVFQNRYNTLRKSIVEHQNISFSSRKKPFIDHMKGMGIDNIFVSWWMNIGDEYQYWSDLMLHVNTSGWVKNRIGRVLDATDSIKSTFPLWNEGNITYLRDIPTYDKNILSFNEQSVLDIISQAQTSIRILGWYLSSPDIVDALIRKSQENLDVSISIILPVRSNLQQWDIQDAVNRLEKEGYNIGISFTDTMIHAKCIQWDDVNALLTSANFDRMSWNFTWELGTEISWCNHIQRELSQYFDSLKDQYWSWQDTLSSRFRSRSIQHLVESLLQRAILSKIFLTHYN
jgi:cardiolipin synthase